MHYSLDACGAIKLLTVVVSLFRLTYRLKMRRFWWEDMWAAVVMVGAVVHSTVNFIYFQTDNFQTAKTARWISSYAFPSIVWWVSVRMCLLYSIIRVVFPFTFLRNLMRAIGALFVIAWAVFISLKVWWCESDFVAAHGRPVCFVPASIAIFEVSGDYAHILVADFAGDVTLVFLSLKLLWGVKLPRRQRRLILSTFASSMVMSMTSLPHAS
ncbi:hypothetical protein HD554DRAFT_2032436, partial [Boletus coccyginus]